MTLNKEFNHQIQIDKVACPLHVLQMKKGMQQIAKGEVLKIISNAYVAPELLAAARQLASGVTLKEALIKSHNFWQRQVSKFEAFVFCIVILW
jgi:TusA-related sulfurtransferase